MPSGLYPDVILIERFLASVTASTLSQKFIAPVDLEVLGMVMTVGTAPGSNNGVILNVSNFPTSQQGGTNASVSAYNLWTATNAPTILGTGTNNAGTTNSTTLVYNAPYALNYPLPGPTGTAGFQTAQSAAQTTETPVVAPPTVFQFKSAGLVAPDNTYNDYNFGVTGVVSPASVVHAGDVLSFVITGGGSGASVGSAANLEAVLVCTKR